MKTKKFITLLTLWGCLAFSTTFAAGYPEYLNDNPSYPLLYAHMDYATYLDADSVVLEYQSNLGTVWAQYEVGAGFHYDWECKIVCVNRYCMNLLYAPYWGKQR